MATTNVTGSLVLKRLKKGKVVYLSLNATGRPLMQEYNPDNGNVSPDFGVAANQPVITPDVSVGDGSKASITSGQWTYNNVPITFGSTATGGWLTSTGAGMEGKFMLNSSTWELKIVKNIAGPNNMDTDTFGFTASGEADGVNYEVKGSTEFLIVRPGESSYVITIYVESGDAVITDDDDTVKLRAYVSVGGIEKNGMTVKWYREDGKTDVKNQNGYSATIGRDDVVGAGMIYARLYSDPNATTVLATAGYEVRDVKDEYDIVVSVAEDSKASEWDGKTPITVKGVLYRMSGGEAVAVETNASQWKHEFRSSAKNTDCGEATGNPVEIGAQQWKDAEEYENLIDFASCTITK